ncbi:MAG: methyltransferase domain-containing protein [Chitinophagaceae bacterium]|nr:methyltransferase domain-containing protein [Chitinophagaceae bacterium]
MDLSHRSYQKELMDGDDIPFDAMARTLRELNIINTRLGGHKITLRGVHEIGGKNLKSSLAICEIGCGGGDNLNAINRHLSRRGIQANFIGIDMNSECIAYARKQYPQLPCQWICSDYTLVKFSHKPDIIFSSLFCHHFTDVQLVDMMKWLRQNTNTGFFINDLHRHWLAYYLIKYITRIFSRSYLVRNDASLSVARSFRKGDWQRYLQEAGIDEYDIRWKWAFRFLVTVRNTRVG